MKTVSIEQVERLCQNEQAKSHQSFGGTLPKVSPEHVEKMRNQFLGHCRAEGRNPTLGAFIKWFFDTI